MMNTKFYISPKATFEQIKLIRGLWIQSFVGQTTAPGGLHGKLKASSCMPLTALLNASCILIVDPLAEERPAISTYSIRRWKMHLVGRYSFV